MSKIIAFDSRSTSCKQKTMAGKGQAAALKSSRYPAEESIETPFATKADIKKLEHRISKWIVGSLAVHAALIVALVIIGII